MSNGYSNPCKKEATLAQQCIQIRAIRIRSPSLKFTLAITVNACPVIGNQPKYTIMQSHHYMPTNSRKKKKQSGRVQKRVKYPPSTLKGNSLHMYK
jgi:hypothetical protein